ncbi:hypothetical protein PKHYL_28720 [Psychrobacter sp. KH172YL61]|nr:hypothetical protein PKHYL_28720 [Psychrobacter sp. KH172YL61]
MPKPFDLDDAVATIYKAINYQPNMALAHYSNESDTHIATDARADSDITPEAPTSTNSKHSKNKAEVTTASKANSNPSGIIGQSQAMQTVFRAIGRLAQSPISVLITGESGTGKELVASALHQHSPRKQQPFIALNMAAIPHDLIESELFGHEKARSLVQRQLVKDVLSRLMAVRYFWTKLATCPLVPKHVCYAYWPMASFIALVDSSRSK